MLSIIGMFWTQNYESEQIGKVVNSVKVVKVPNLAWNRFNEFGIDDGFARSSLEFNPEDSGISIAWLVIT